jgi:hypothetical protein
MPKMLKGDVVGVVDLLVGRASDRTFAIGPLVCQPSDGTSAKQWYFVVSTLGRDKHFHSAAIVTPDGESNRRAVIAELLVRARSVGGLVVHTFEDELDMLRCCEQLWPDERIASLRQEVEAERNVASR